MKRSLLLLGVLIAAGLTLASGLIHGRMTQRWKHSKASDSAAQRLAELPDTFGKWQGQSLEELDQETVDMLQCAGYVVRVYVNEETGAAIKMALLLGPAGPISVHTPEICFSGRNYLILEKRKRVQIPEDSKDEFWGLTFQSKGLGATQLRVYYAWTTGGTWAAPDRHPRYKFAGRPYLYKIQLAGSLPPGADATTDDPCREFLRDFVPVARPYLVDPSTD